jgi:hypothetical protein
VLVLGSFVQLRRMVSGICTSGGQNMRGFCGSAVSRISGEETADGIGVLAFSLDDPTVGWRRFVECA